MAGLALELRVASVLQESQVMTHTYEYPRPMVACTVILTADVPGSYGPILLGLRKGPTEGGKWSLPGGFLNEGRETAQECAARELQEETGVLLGASSFILCDESSLPFTDPRGHVVNLVFRAQMHCHVKPRAGDDITAVRWCDPLDALRLDLAFDHWDILATYVRGRLR